GPHFKFDLEGSDVPPNEIHLGFTSSADGSGEATITSDEQVGDGAPAVVVHPADAMDNRLACADFS
ncbi:MAG: superoxide dismutase family protein, partial [Actinobacteria bacterium]|nr:superoxide dismutase family protein [Actinomycetota bacterium]